MALESILNRTYTHQSDVWSYGRFSAPCMFAVPQELRSCEIDGHLQSVSELRFGLVCVYVMCVLSGVQAARRLKSLGNNG